MNPEPRAEPVGAPLPLEKRAALARALRGGISVHPTLALAAVLSAAVVASVRGCALALPPAAVNARALHLSGLGLAGAAQPAG